MFRGFDLNISKEFFKYKEYSFDEYKEMGEKHLEAQKAQYQKSLKEYINKDKINGAKIQAEWFPPIEADIFISHSHKDIDIASALAGWIHKTFGLNCFIDSHVWGYSQHLLKIMNDALSNMRPDRDGGILYDHDSCNLVSQHVNAMLSIALQKMIDKAEATILINTSHSIEVHYESQMNETYSPWIYTEIICTEIVRKKPLIAYRDYHSYVEHSDQSVINESAELMFQIAYEVSLGHLIELSEADLNIWENKWKENRIHCDIQDAYPLDSLYRIVCPEEVAKATRIAAMLSPEEAAILREIYSGADNNVQSRERIAELLTESLESTMEKVMIPCRYFNVCKKYMYRKQSQDDQ